MEKLIRITPKDNVAVALAPVEKGERVSFGGESIAALEDIPQGHKIALTDLPQGGSVIKYGFPIGRTTAGIKKGGWVHIHNVKTGLSEQEEYVYRRLRRKPSSGTAGRTAGLESATKSGSSRPSAA